MPRGPKGEKRPAEVMGNTIKVMPFQQAKKLKSYRRMTARTRLAKALGKKGICAPKTPSEMAPPANVAPVSAPRELPAADEPQPAPSVDGQLAPAVPYDIMLGVTGDSPQYGLLGDVSGRRVAIDLNQTHTVSLFGVQGGGKSYTLVTIAEMASGDAARHHQLDLAGAAPDLLAAGAADLSDATQTALSPA